MSIPETELESLKGDGLEYTTVAEANMTCIVVKNFGLPAGYNRADADLLLRLPAGFPDTPPDMWWFDPPVVRADGSKPPATDAVEQHVGRTWQRWSRHFNAGQWRPGLDSLETFLALIRKELHRCVEPAQCA
ncbi:MAG TPA: E2/UBC family protein [Pseudolabrys sp.]